MEKKRQIAAVLILLALIGVIAYRHSTGKDLEKYEASFFDVFDTQTQIIGYASSKEQFSEQMSLIKDKFQYYNDLYDIYHDYEGMNNIKTINDNAGIQPVKVDEEIIELLKLGITMDEKTDGNMNIAMGSVLSIWHDYREAGSAGYQDGADVVHSSASVYARFDAGCNEGRRTDAGQRADL